MLFLAIYLLVHCGVTSSIKPFWMDELIDFRLVTDPSLTHALDALGHGADGGFPLYYVVAWSVARFTAHTELSLRLISSVILALAFSVLFGVLQRAYGRLPAMLAIVISIGGCTLILVQNSEMRFYTTLFASAALAVAGYDLLFRRAVAADDHPGPGGGALALNAVAHAMLALCHPFGLVYSAAVSAAAVAVWWWRRPQRFLLSYLISAAVGDAAFLWWLKGFLRQTAIVEGHGHLAVPSATDFVRVYLQLLPSLYYNDSTKARLAQTFLPASQHRAALGLTAVLALIVLATAALALWRRLKDAAATRKALGQSSDWVNANDGHLVVLAAVFVCVPTGTWILSHLSKPLFLYRYFIPSVMGFTILYAHLFLRLLGTRSGQGTRSQRPNRGLDSILWSAAGLSFVALYLIWPLAAVYTAPDGFTLVRARLAQNERGLPVLCNVTNDYWQLSHYAHENLYWFLLDREVAHDPRNGISALAEFNFSSVHGRYYPDEHIVSSAEFLHAHREFIVETAEENLWYNVRIGGNPAYRSEKVPGLPAGTTQVTQIAPIPPDEAANQP